MAGRVFGMQSEIFAGVLLAGAAAAGLIVENISFLRPLYDAFLNTTMTVAIGDGKISKPLLLWINDGLMAIFFLLVGLEIKREVKRGALSTWQRAAMPVYGALGGIVVPVIVFLSIVGLESAESAGWAIPAATDIAFALGVLSLFGDRVPPALKTFLLALAVVDDLAAIIIIALFFTDSLSIYALGTAALALGALLAMNLGGVKKGAPYILLGLLLWVAVLKSGVHATLAGVALGFLIPLEADKNGRSIATEYEHGLHPWVAFGVMPIFAFANAGVPLGGITLDTVLAPLPLGIAAGLFIGKQVGVFGFVYVAVKAGLATKPSDITWQKVYGAACLAGIGFTMSLFIGSLAFEDIAMANAVRMGVLMGSISSGLLGAFVLYRSAQAAPIRIDELEPEYPEPLR